MRNKQRLSLAVALWAALFVVAAGDRSRAEMSEPAMSALWDLPVRADAPAAVASASHLLLLRLEAVTPAAAAGTDRRLTLRLVPEALFKGALAALPGQPATITVMQTGIDPYGEGPPPVLDPDRLRPGERYLLDAVAPGETNLAALFAPAAARGLYPAALAEDAREAWELEQRFRAAPTDPALPPQVLAVAQARRGQLHELFGEYLLLRLTPILNDDPPRLLAPLLDLALDPQSTSGLALTLLGALDLLALDLSARADFERLLCAGIAALDRPLPPVVAATLATQNLYNLVFDTGPAPPLDAGRCGLPTRTLEAVRQRLRGIGDERADQLADWLP